MTWLLDFTTQNGSLDSAEVERNAPWLKAMATAVQGEGHGEGRPFAYLRGGGTCKRPQVPAAAQCVAPSRQWKAGLLSPGGRLQRQCMVLRPKLRSPYHFAVLLGCFCGAYCTVYTNINGCPMGELKRQTQSGKVPPSAHCPLPILVPQ